MTHRIDNDQLLDLVHGLLPEERRREVLDAMHDDPDAEARFQRLVRVREQILAQAAQPPNDTAAAHSHHRPAKDSRLRRWLPTSGLVAAAIAAVVWWQPWAGDPIDAYTWLPENNYEVVNEAEALGPTEELLREAMEAYRDRKPRRVAELLEQLTGADLDSLDESRRLIHDLYLASVKVITGDPAAALAIVDQLEAQYGEGFIPEPFDANADWVRYLALRQLKDDSAGTLLHSLMLRDDDIGRYARDEQERLGQATAP